MGILNLSPEPEQEESAVENYKMLSLAKGGANWFYWIAGLSLVNSVIFLYGGNWSFFIGLGITQLLDAIVDQLTGNGVFSFVKIIVFTVDIIIAAIFILCGLWANKFQIWAFVVGMVLYFLDGILLLLLGAYLPAGFHVFVLFILFKGLSAARQVNANQNLATS